MRIRKAVITAAGRHQRRLPLQRFVDLDGEEKTALQILIEELTAAGVEEICLVVQPGDAAVYLEAAREHGRMLAFMEQPQPRATATPCTAPATSWGTSPLFTW
jgi:UTP--glucose-1-phosphate uridylyltransferase